MSYSFRKDLVPSGQAWIGGLPRDWELHRLGKFFKARNEKVSDSDFPALSVTKSGIVPQLDTAAKTDAGDNRKRVCVGDFVINSRSDRKGSAGVSPLDGSVSLISIVLEPRGIHRQFAHNLLRSYPFQEEFYRFGKGIVADLWSTNYSEMKNIIIPVPSADEQLAIANFLDRETAKIDTLIDQQEQLIKLLEEKRRAVISHAVIKGLNPDVRMKDSGVEWLGEVPEHWTVRRSKFLFEFVTSGSRGWGQFYADDGELFFRISNLTRNSIDVDGSSLQFVQPPAGSEGERSRIHVGDLLISITADLGSVAVANDLFHRGYVSQHVALCRPNKQVGNPRWLGYCFISDQVKQQFLSSGYGGTKVQLSLPDVREVCVPLPPQEERNQIAEFIDGKLSELDAVVLEGARLIQLLKERRTALISAAATGKIDVRNAV